MSETALPGLKEEQTDLRGYARIVLPFVCYRRSTMQKIKIWSVPEDDGAGQQVQPIKEVHSTEAEKRLEDLLVQEQGR